MSLASEISRLACRDFFRTVFDDFRKIAEERFYKIVSGARIHTLLDVRRIAEPGIEYDRTSRETPVQYSTKTKAVTVRNHTVQQICVEGLQPGKSQCFSNGFYRVNFDVGLLQQESYHVASVGIVLQKK